MRRFLIIAVVVVLGGGAFWATWSFLQGPHYALYQIGKAIHQRQPRLFLAYVDVDQIARGQKDELVKQYMADRSESEQRQVGMIVEALLGSISQQIKERVAQAVADPERENIPTSWTLVFAAQVTRNDDYALVLLQEPEGGKNRRLRVGMRRSPELGQWQVVEVNSQDLKVLLDQYLQEQQGG